jgi:predicted transcriptional regulator
MSRRKPDREGRPPELSDLQLAVMRVLWTRGRATVAEVHEALEDERGLAPTTIATTLARLEKRGVVEHETEGRQFVYVPRYGESAVKRSMVGALTERLFRGDAAELVNHLLAEREIEPAELERLKQRIEARQRQDAEDAR